VLFDLQLCPLCLTLSKTYVLEHNTKSDGSDSPKASKSSRLFFPKSIKSRPKITLFAEPELVQADGFRRRFAIAKAASVYRQAPPAPMPIIAGGNSDPRSGLAPSHPSHLQAVQEVAPSFGGGSGTPVEMWPLQLFEYADRLKLGANIPLQAPPTPTYTQSSATQQRLPMSPAVAPTQPHAPPPPLHQPVYHSQGVGSPPSMSMQPVAPLSPTLMQPIPLTGSNVQQGIVPNPVVPPPNPSPMHHQPPPNQMRYQQPQHPQNYAAPGK